MLFHIVRLSVTRRYFEGTGLPDSKLIPARLKDSDGTACASFFSVRFVIFFYLVCLCALFLVLLVTRAALCCLEAGTTGCLVCLFVCLYALLVIVGRVPHAVRALCVLHRRIYAACSE